MAGKGTVSRGSTKPRIFCFSLQFYMMRNFIRFLTLILFCLIRLAVQGQDKHTVSGYVRDSLSGETMIGATLSINGRSVNSNQYGFFSMTLPSKTYQLVCSFVGYESKSITIQLTENQEISILMTPRGKMNEEVVVYARKKDNNVRSGQMGKFDLSMSQIKSLPVVFGEVDILKTLQLLPGVRNAGEGNAGFYVRGGGADQNLIMLDDAVVYNTGHLFGFFSIFNGDAIKNTSLIKGGMPAQYGGRLSSVLDISMKEGNMNEWKLDGGIGLIASRFSVQGPLIKEKASFIVSARRTYVDAIVKPFVPRSSAFYGSGYFFYDLNAKVNYKFSEKDRLYVSGYFGKDVFDFRNAQRSFDANIPWGNATATVRWNHVFNRKLFSNTTLVYNRYNFAFNAGQNDFDFSLRSGIRDLSAKFDMDYYPASQHKVKFGAMYTHHQFTPNVLSGRQGDTEFSPDNSTRKNAVEMALYVQDDWDLSDRLKINAGLRYSGFAQVGPYTLFQRDINGNKTDSTQYQRGDRVKTYGGLEPRLTMRYTLDAQTSVKASITRNYQYIHLVSNAGSTLPTDLWVPSTLFVQPQKSWQYAAGIFKNFKDNTFETSIEVYYKTMQNQVEYREGYTPSLRDPEEEFTFGKGWSYGTELFINKVRGRFTGWVGYTLSWTYRQFPALNNGDRYPARYDRRHDLSVVGSYSLNERWKLGAVFVYGTGSATTLPEQFYVINGVLTQEYSRINQYRLAAYHRLDVSATYTPVQKKPRRWTNSWVFSIYNLYSRLNPYFVYFDQTGSPYDGSLQVDARQVSLFPIIPSVTWNFSF
jgi:hypothetical protein